MSLYKYSMTEIVKMRGEIGNCRKMGWSEGG